MCTNGINTGQFEQMIDQIDDHIKLERRWVHTLAHQAGDAGFTATDDKLHKVQELLDARLSPMRRTPSRTMPRTLPA